MRRTVQTVLAAGLLAIALAAPPAGSAWAQDRPAFKAVLELFTSQGCSACPPADALLARYIERPDTLALSLPVDYWDYLGWKDTFASPRFSQRQRLYAHHKGSGWSVYTPQVVINGVLHAVGSRQKQIDKSIMAAAKIAPLWLPVRFENTGSAMTIRIGATPEAGPSKNSDIPVTRTGVPSLQSAAATVWLLMVKTSADVTIGRGENRGRKLSYRNIVREMTPIGSWIGEPETIRIDLSVVTTSDWNACAVLVQDGKGGPIVGAAWMDG